MVLLGFFWFVFCLEAVGLDARLHRRARHRPALGQRLPAHRRDVPVRAAGARAATARSCSRATSCSRSRSSRRCCSPPDPAPDNLLLVRDDPALADTLSTLGALVYLALFVVVPCAARTAGSRARRSSACSSRPSTPSRSRPSCSSRSPRASTATWPGGARCISTAIMPFAFLGGLMRSEIVSLDPRCARAWRSSAPRARGSSRRPTPSGAGSSATCTTARSRAWSRWRCTCGSRASKADGELGGDARPGVGGAAGQPAGAARAGARHPPGGAHRPRARAGAAGARRPRAGAGDVEAVPAERLPGAVETAAYFVASEALTNVAKYAQATEASVSVRRVNGRVRVEVADDGIGGAERGQRLGPARAVGPRGRARRQALGGEPAGQGTRLRARDPGRGG